MSSSASWNDLPTFDGIRTSDDPADDGPKVVDEAEARYDVQHGAKRPATEEFLDHAQPARGEHETQRDRDDERDDLIAGQRGDERTDREMPTSH